MDDDSLSSAQKFMYRKNTSEEKRSMRNSCKRWLHKIKLKQHIEASKMELRQAKSNFAQQVTASHKELEKAKTQIVTLKCSYVKNLLGALEVRSGKKERKNLFITDDFNLTVSQEMMYIAMISMK